MERWQLSLKEIAKYNIIRDTIKGHLRTHQAAKELGLCVRQIFRLKKALREKGTEGFIHGNKGKPSPLRIPERLRDKVDSLYTGKYTGFNLSHFTEMLEERESIVLSRETVRGILLKKGSYEKRKNNPNIGPGESLCPKKA